jgi:hypothetical protein
MAVYAADGGDSMQTLWRLATETELLIAKHWDAIRRVAMALLTADRFEEAQLENLIAPLHGPWPLASVSRPVAGRADDHRAALARNREADAVNLASRNAGGASDLGSVIRLG